MPRLHSDTLLPPCFAAFSNPRSSSDVTRTRRNFPFDSPLGSFGRPGFLVFFASVTFSRLLYDGGSDGCLWRYHGRNVQHGHVPLWVFRIVCVVHPCIDFVRLRMTSETEDFHDSIPRNQVVILLRHRHALDVRCANPVHPVNHVSQFVDMAHAAASTKSPTLQNDGATPAAIAGAQHSLLCRLTRL